MKGIAHRRIMSCGCPTSTSMVRRHRATKHPPKRSNDSFELERNRRLKERYSAHTIAGTLVTGVLGGEMCDAQ